MTPLDLVESIEGKLGIRINPPTISHWEESDLLGKVPIKKSGRRDYSEENLKRLQQVVFLKGLNLKTRQIKRFFENDMAIKELVIETLNAYEENLMPYGKKLLGI